MNEQTSARVARLAGDYLNITAGELTGLTAAAAQQRADEIQAIAGSALTQVRDREETPLPHGIHPAPAEFTPEQIAADNLLHFFHYAHLPEKLQATSKAFFLLAHHVVVTVPRTPERTVALRKLLEAKDAAVRANLPTPERRPLPTSEKISTDDTDIEVIEQGGHDQDRDGPIPFDA